MFDPLEVQGGSLAGLLEAVPDAVVICTEDGRIVHANSSAAELTGYSQDELLSLHVESLVPPLLRSRHERHRVTFANEKEARRPMGAGLDTKLLRKDGSILPVDIALSRTELQGVPIVAAALRDISERRQVERALRQQATLLELANDAVLVRTAERKVITYWNQAAAETYGYSRAEAIGADADELLLTPPSLAGEISAQLAATGRWEGELVQRRRDGLTVSVSSRQVLLPAESGDESTVLEINRDVTLERRTYEQLAVIADRERLARDLTSTTIHALFGVGLELQATGTISTEAAVQARLDAAVDVLDQVVRELRGFVFSLAEISEDGTQPPELEAVPERKAKEPGSGTSALRSVRRRPASRFLR